MSTGHASSGQAADDPILTTALAAAVPLWIMQSAHLAPGERSARGRTLASIVASQGDNILYRSPRAGATAAAFSALAEGLALAAYQPGGVTFAGFHWCTDHAACEKARAAAESMSS